MRHPIGTTSIPHQLAEQAARRIAIAQAEQALSDCIAFGEFLTRFQLDMLNRSPWSTEQYAGIERAEIEVSTRTASVLTRLDDLMGGIR